VSQKDSSFNEPWSCRNPVAAHRFFSLEWPTKLGGSVPSTWIPTADGPTSRPCPTCTCLPVPFNGPTAPRSQKRLRSWDDPRKKVENGREDNKENTEEGTRSKEVDRRYGRKSSCGVRGNGAVKWSHAQKNKADSVWRLQASQQRVQHGEREEPTQGKQRN